MNPRDLGITVTSKRDAGSVVEHSFGLPQGQESNMLASLLTAMESGQELSVPDPSNGDCQLEAKRTLEGFSIKRGCHGAYGTWQKASESEAHAWLLPGALAASNLCAPGFGVVLVTRKAIGHG